MYQFNTTLTPFQRFAEQITVGDGCWNWVGTKRQGYGRLVVSGKTVSAHRFSWEYYKGNIPAGMKVLHHCDTPACVRPSHLFIGTQKDNAQDMTRKGRRFPTHGEGNPRAKLTSEKVKEIRTQYHDHSVSRQVLATRYGVSEGTIWFIVKNLTWIK